MSHCTFPSEVSPIYFYAYPSSPSATRYFFPFNSCLAYFMPSGRAIPAMHLSTASNSRGVLCPKSPPSAGTSDCQHKVLLSTYSEQLLLHRPPRAPAQWLFEFSMRNYLSFDWFTTHIHYCPLLQDPARLRCLPSPPMTKQPHLPYH